MSRESWDPEVWPDEPPPGRSVVGGHVCTYEFQFYCGAKVCTECGDHKHLARCYCGWAADGGNGYNQLIELGEVIDCD